MSYLGQQEQNQRDLSMQNYQTQKRKFSQDIQQNQGLLGTHQYNKSNNFQSYVQDQNTSQQNDPILIVNDGNNENEQKQSKLQQKNRVTDLQYQPKYPLQHHEFDQNSDKQKYLQQMRQAESEQMRQYEDFQAKNQKSDENIKIKQYLSNEKYQQDQKIYEKNQGHQYPQYLQNQDSNLDKQQVQAQKNEDKYQYIKPQQQLPRLQVHEKCPQGARIIPQNELYKYIPNYQQQNNIASYQNAQYLQNQQFEQQQKQLQQQYQQFQFMLENQQLLQKQQQQQQQQQQHLINYQGYDQNLIQAPIYQPQYPHYPAFPGQGQFNPNSQNYPVIYGDQFMHQDQFQVGTDFDQSFRRQNSKPKGFQLALEDDDKQKLLLNEIRSGYLYKKDKLTYPDTYTLELDRKQALLQQEIEDERKFIIDQEKRQIQQRECDRKYKENQYLDFPYNKSTFESHVNQLYRKENQDLPRYYEKGKNLVDQRSNQRLEDRIGRKDPQQLKLEEFYQKRPIQNYNGDDQRIYAAEDKHIAYNPSISLDDPILYREDISNADRALSNATNYLRQLQ
ncbi:hypothetical protein PPERSA_04543 [Pseudocohnilembus persalinus]|uniref:Uncharacterized protein n=1 Tax=Pseudocohnilembus persalinus TaxID=266149 RepID=A0A0V0QT87_PSEPJ|nr:hypothetical protein PPERSA_04543 [Pseudocohnilembus persalinus]|eukprot:KRX05506.1 hypothetical protein PPERSA_04543 [Pseudocohnilembus persalinus]